MAPSGSIYPFKSREGLKKGEAREEVCSVAGEEEPELVAAPKN
jgi:hypothetical protein